MADLRSTGESASSRRSPSVPPPAGVDPVLPPGFDEDGNPVYEEARANSIDNTARPDERQSGLGWPLWAMIVIAGIALGIAIALTAAGNF